jgi:tripartite-type tricarboxylate transporter receptor subunit TctC
MIKFRLFFMGLIALGVGTNAFSQTYPTKPLRLICPFAAGATTDLVARAIATELSNRIGQPVIVENRAGGGGNPGTEFVAKAPADGYTLAFVPSGNIVINPFLFKSLGFDPAVDLTPVALVAEAPQYLVVSSNLQVRTLRELIDYAKANTGKFNYASAGVGSTNHFGGYIFSQLIGIDATHIPYKGVAPAITDVLEGRVQLMSVGLGPVAALVQSGKLRALAVGSKRRQSATPDIPTASEAGLPGYEVVTWWGTLAPRGTPGDIVRQLNRQSNLITSDAQMQKRFRELVVEPLGGTPEEFAAVIKADLVRWRDVVQSTGVKAE